MTVRYAPRGRDVGLIALGAVLLTGLAVAADPLGRLLGGAGVVGLMAFAVVGAAVRPRLAADPAGVSVRTLTARHRLQWSDVDRLAVDERTRLGRTVRTLEIESGDLLVVFGRYTLGADPADVRDALLRLRA